MEIQSCLSTNTGNSNMNLPNVSRFLVALKKTLPAVLLLGSLCLATAPVARAQLTLNLDTTAKTLWFTGSDSGTTAIVGALHWQTGGSGSVVHYTFTVADLLTSTLTFSNQHEFQTTSNNDGFALILNGASATTAVTLTGKGSSFTYDYSGFSANDQTFLEGLTSIPFTTGTGFSSITVSASAVPEPSTYAAIFGAIALLGTIAVRKRAKRA
ncbi:MAG: PEP-CTERM sorting domain-containing protein [Cephaloticoccus sp.]|nr:PEP-CTERM sorting domain-containing protein [Cephaloticoccus sp.]MCF7761662.1 PEP-CTERM sorting domain-containing protein [Cephaloticoccus sp.]